jgi:hypothetical protein
VRIIRIIKDGEKTVRQDIQPDLKPLNSFIKDESKITRQEIQLDLENLSTIRPEDLQLRPGDMVFIDRKHWATVQDIFGVLVPVVLLTSSVMQIINITK